MLWGVLGGFSVEGLQFSGAIRRVGGWPWRKRGEPGLWPFVVSVVIRLAIGGGLAAACAAGGQLAGPFAAVAVGIAAPYIVEQLAQQAAISDPGQAAPQVVRPAGKRRRSAPAKKVPAEPSDRGLGGSPLPGALGGADEG